MEGDANRGCGRRRECHRDQRSRAILEQEQLDRQEHRADGTAERGRHSSSGPGRKEHLPLVGGDMDELTEERAECSSRRDDRTFGSEGTSRPDGDGSRKRFEEEDARRDSALAQQHLFHHFGNAVPANRRRSVSRHHAHHQGPCHRNEGEEHATAVASRRIDELS